MNGYHIFNGIYSKLYYICKYENIVHLWIGRNDVYFVTYIDNVDNSYKMFYSKHGFISNVMQFIQNTSKYNIRQLLISKHDDELITYFIRYNKVSIEL